uniref:Rho GTPase-activating protein 20-like isoform X1 n=1 Tax=Phascolarctos cinereus TaxID=38626 RepID=A0A6P5JP20_PHACI|nr:rho GTPase-activating protein 20-like isoform X1 [Phascolarctos cinereus]
MEQLPKANIILLRNVFEMLHSIEQQSASNQMTAFNLAVCIAPSMLWPPYSATPQLENKFIEKILLLAQYIIENCGRIFAEEATSLLSYDRDNASGIMNHWMVFSPNNMPYYICQLLYHQGGLQAAKSMVALRLSKGPKTRLKGRGN